MCEEAWESSVHRGELRKCGKEEKHDQSSRSSTATVNHTRAEVHKQDTERDREKGEVERGRIDSVVQKDKLNLSKKRNWRPESATDRNIKR